MADRDTLAHNVVMYGTVDGSGHFTPSDPGSRAVWEGLAFDANSMLEGARAARAAMLRDAGALRVALGRLREQVAALDGDCHDWYSEGCSHNDTNDPPPVNRVEVLALIDAALASDTGGSSTAPETPAVSHDAPSEAGRANSGGGGSSTAGDEP